MENLSLHLEYFCKLVKCNALKFKALVISSSVDQLRAIVNLLHLCADKKSGKEHKLLRLFRPKLCCAKKIKALLLKHRALVQSILCVALQVLIRMTSATILEHGEC